ncbi:SDR family oxidoreductase [Actinomadura syzygii]|uniref:SDR family oxidoreductase n=1 Tax=Actinomadura syzygii TaxID=1427538 RepID=A0A5D0TTK1_9ACTN|nr:SDR family oxidoreductase [Actinomadura syzygii]TYC09044.1 SDR family oxidoreductase [Actinomadura syzygii]
MPPTYDAKRLLDGRTVIVSGVGPGLGRRTALAAAAAGAWVVLGGRSAEAVGKVAAEVAATGARTARLLCDVTSDADCRALVALAQREFGGVDCVVNNAFASAPHGTTLENADVDRWRETMDVTLFGSLRMTKAALPELRRSRGSVVFVGSQSMRRIKAGRGPYATAKSALVTAAQVLAREVGPDGIRVNTIVPGRMWGPSLRTYIDRLAAERGTSAETETRSMVGDNALPRLTSDEECARVIVFLASDLSYGMTGQTVDVNAGETFH